MEQAFVAVQTQDVPLLNEVLAGDAMTRWGYTQGIAQLARYLDVAGIQNLDDMVVNGPVLLRKWTQQPPQNSGERATVHEHYQAVIQSVKSSNARMTLSFACKHWYEDGSTRSYCSINSITLQ